MAATLLARGGARTLLVDRAAFPRPKVCGCCIGQGALAALDRAGLRREIEALAGETLRRVRLHAYGAEVSLPLRSGVALSREVFDQALVAAARRAGAVFVDRASARLGAPVGGRRTLSLDTPGGEARVSTKVVLAADGVGGRLLEHEPGMRSRVRRGAKIGMHTVLRPGACDIERGEVRMVCARDGYVGFVRLEDGRVNIAAAVRHDALRETLSPPALAQRIMEANGLPLPDAAHESAWKGTPPLTRRRRAAGYRLFALGDSAGYTEPFTGEGIGWALCGAEALAPIALRATGRWSDAHAQAWIDARRRVVEKRMRACRMVVWALDHPRLTRAALRAATRWPQLAERAPGVGRGRAASPAPEGGA